MADGSYRFATYATGDVNIYIRQGDGNPGARITGITETFSNGKRIFTIPCALLTPGDNYLIEILRGSGGTDQYDVKLIGDANLYAISGASTVCSTNSTFRINNLPAGTAVSWTRGGSLTYVSGQATSSYVVRASSSTVRGDAWVQATITGPCGSLTLPRKNLWVGPPDQAHKYNLFVQGFSGQSSITLASQGLYTFQINPVKGANNYNWQLPPGFSFLQGYGQHSYVAKIWTPSQGGNYTLKCFPTGACGSSGTGSQSLSIYIPGGPSGGGPGGDPNCPLPPCQIPDPASIYPNPATTKVTLSFSDDVYESSLKEGYSIKIYNQHQKMVYESISNKKAWEVDTKKFPKGLYIINVYYKEGVLQE